MKRQHEEDSSCGEEEDSYHLRTKRVRKTVKVRRRCVRRNPLVFLPTEIVLIILNYISYEELGNSVRLVCRKFRVLSEIVLNAGFLKIEEKLTAVKKMIAESLTHTQDDMETRCMCKMLNTIEYIIFHYTIIRSTIWRYMGNERPEIATCMYAGSLLDLYYDIVQLYTKEPQRIYSPSILNDYALPKEVIRLSQLSKIFVLYFDRACEQEHNTSALVAGAKILDILDCATEARKFIQRKVIENNYLFYEVTYFFSNSWLVALEINDEKPKPWNEQMRLMYMRLRRIVVSHTEMHMEYAQFRREKALRINPRSRLKKPVNSVYTGYGEVGDMFYYYGAMNEGAFLNKFVDLPNEHNIFGEDADAGIRNDEFVPFVGLKIKVSLKCPARLGPWTLQKEVVAEKRPDQSENGSKETFDMSVAFEYPGAKYPRLPTNLNIRITNLDGL